MALKYAHLTLSSPLQWKGLNILNVFLKQNQSCFSLKVTTDKPIQHIELET